ncbi:hypothetical protein MLGJGCBP_08598 [Rhodococcus sp. T7]|nr:hypothetical protein MLGJGCBP_08598 [Rhodococcus sp. T7]
MICVRLAREVSRHPGNAAAAESMTARASSTLANATSPVTAPVAGLVTRAVFPLVPAKLLLSNQCEMIRPSPECEMIRPSPECEIVRVCAAPSLCVMKWVSLPRERIPGRSARIA